MTPLHVTLILATLLCSLVAGFLFAFAVVIMPGIGRLRDREHIRAFQAMDRVIQDNDPLFMAVWVGSVLALLAATVLAFGSPSGAVRWLTVGALAAYVLGVQLPTGAINVPLNNRLQALDVDATGEDAHRDARQGFEGRWNRANTFRTVACLVSATLMAVLAML
ncbi:MAG TPA: DUF1772 domain-containing protein [Longimicrobiales bacterium]|nr:DUF1772 domain-containing protein [Longimicrobiales bacterium]